MQLIRFLPFARCIFEPFPCLSLRLRCALLSLRLITARTSDLLFCGGALLVRTRGAQLRLMEVITRLFMLLCFSLTPEARHDDREHD